MHIHRTKKNDTVYSIAKEYGIAPSKIIEYNGLQNANRLSVGEELLIPTPTRTYKVQKGDTLSGVAMRFGTKRRELVRSNPTHAISASLDVGEILVIKSESERFGTAVANGYFFCGCTEAKLKTALPYLTYVTVASVMSDEKGLKRLFNDESVVKVIKENSKIPLLRIYDTGKGGYCTDENERRKFTENIIDAATKGGYSGIVLSAYRAAEKDANAFGEYIIYLRKQMIGSDLILFTEIDETSPTSAADYADGSVLSYDKISLSSIPSFDDGERKVFTEFANTCEGTKVFIDIPSLAFFGDRYISIDDAIKLSHDKGAEIMHDDKKKISYFSIGGKNVVFESMDNIKSKLSLLSELGFMGISVDIMRVPISTLMMYNSVFKTFSYINNYYGDI